MLSEDKHHSLTDLTNALSGRPGQSQRADAEKLIAFLSEDWNTSAIAFAVMKAASHAQAFGETEGVQCFLTWAATQLEQPEFDRAVKFMVESLLKRARKTG